jgi:hypothetical protein
LWSSNRSPAEQREVLREAMRDSEAMSDLQLVDRFFPSVRGHVSLRADPEPHQQVVVKSSKKLAPVGSRFGMSQVEGDLTLHLTSHVPDGAVGPRLELVFEPTARPSLTADTASDTAAEAPFTVLVDIKPGRSRSRHSVSLPDQFSSSSLLIRGMSEGGEVFHVLSLKIDC